MQKERDLSLECYMDANHTLSDIYQLDLVSTWLLGNNGNYHKGEISKNVLMAWTGIKAQEIDKHSLEQSKLFNINTSMTRNHSLRGINHRLL